MYLKETLMLFLFLSALPFQARGITVEQGILLFMHVHHSCIIMSKCTQTVVVATYLDV